MSYAHIIKEIGRGAEGSRNVTQEDAKHLYGAMLDGGVPDLEMGAILIALRAKGESAEEMIGFLTAANERVNALHAPHGGVRPVVIPSYNGARKSANLTPLLALLLQRFGVPVVVHGLLEGFGRVTSGHVFREIGVLPSVSQSAAQQALNEHNLAFVPLSVITPGLADPLRCAASSACATARTVWSRCSTPSAGKACCSPLQRIQPTWRPCATYLVARAHTPCCLRATEGEPFANPKHRPRIEHLHEGLCDILFEAEHDSLKALPQLPEEC